ncbi:sugar phosphate isomerase/epimerase family protein [Moorella sulfitireducens (nom. illeg.)]|uniref:sugar phosphate isomerase/epimerase family protein n=1 Tax=Neomoorella sulfitireducens TaxID=2972948 RepID=UPI0021AC8DCB|nr:sugar phosphate isomerase/epimerase family protein [Moorella sulfitireducens]
MKLSISIAQNVPASAPFILRGPYLDNIKKAAELGYDAVEIHVRDPRELEVEQILKVCQKERITVSTLGTGLGYVEDKLSLTHPNAQIREKAAKRILDHIEVASYLGAGVIVGSMRGVIPDTGRFKEYENYAGEGLAVCLQKAQKCGVVLFLEAINRYETNFLNTAADTLNFITRFNSPYLKIHLDTFHMNIEEVDLAGAIKSTGRALGHIHFADSNRFYPGQGHLDFKKIIATLKNIGYKGYIALECLPYPAPEEAAAGAIKYLKSLLEEN